MPHRRSEVSVVLEEEPPEDTLGFLCDGVDDVHGEIEFSRIAPRWADAAEAESRNGDARLVELM